MGMSARRRAQTEVLSLDRSVHRRNDSTASATAIVAQLASALQPDPLVADDNPFDFEPIPLAGRSKKKAKTEKPEDSKS